MRKKLMKYAEEQRIRLSDNILKLPFLNSKNNLIENTNY